MWSSTAKSPAKPTPDSDWPLDHVFLTALSWDDDVIPVSSVRVPHWNSPQKSGAIKASSSLFPGLSQLPAGVACPSSRKEACCRANCCLAMACLLLDRVRTVPSTVADNKAPGQWGPGLRNNFFSFIVASCLAKIEGTIEGTKNAPARGLRNAAGLDNRRR